jgi:hypothetical protein
MDVRFTPESGHQRLIVWCPLSAKSRHRNMPAQRVGDLFQWEDCGDIDFD